jgi:ammonia channel protein AmtB
MMVLKNNQLTIVKQLLLLLLLVLVANWFFTFQLVCLKDDNSFYYMPVRMYLSDALHKEVCHIGTLI